MPFGSMEWPEDAPGIRVKEADVSGSRWAVVEYGERVGRAEWCQGATAATFCRARSNTSSMTGGSRCGRAWKRPFYCRRQRWDPVLIAVAASLRSPPGCS